METPAPHIVDKPHLDRSQLLAAEEECRKAVKVAESLTALLGPGECLGAPSREADLIEIPVLLAEKEADG